MNITVKKVVDNEFKNRKSFFNNIGTYRDAGLNLTTFWQFFSLKLYVQYEVTILP